MLDEMAEVPCMLVMEYVKGKPLLECTEAFEVRWCEHSSVMWRCGGVTERREGERLVVWRWWRRDGTNNASNPQTLFLYTLKPHRVIRPRGGCLRT